MGEAKRALDRHLSQQEASEREDRLHKRAQRAEGDLLKANAIIADLRSKNERLASIIRRMDQVTPHADLTCDDPGITLSEAVQRETPSLRCAALQRKAGER